MPRQPQRKWWDPTTDYEVELRPEVVAAQVHAQWAAWIEAHATNKGA